MNVIQVGVGGMGHHWVKWLTSHPKIKLVGLVDVSADALARAREVGGYAPDICYNKLSDAFSKVRADVLMISTPPQFHCAAAVAGMRAGLDVITEKPMADTLANCRTMVRVSKETGRTCVVSQNYRFSAPMWTLAGAVRRNLVGPVGQVKLDFYLGMDFGGGFRHVMEYPQLVDMAIHHFDLIRFVTGLDAIAVQGAAWNPAWSNYAGDCSNSLVFEMTNGARVLYNASWCCKGQHTDWNGNWLIEGAKGALTHQRGVLEFTSVPKLYTERGRKTLPTTPPRHTGQLHVINEFLQARAKGARPSTDVFDNIKSMAMVFAAVTAVRTGKRVPVRA